MKWLIDNALSRIVAEGLRAEGHDALHVIDVGLARADDLDVLRFARSEGRVLVSADADFGALLASERSTAPSIVLFRRTTGHSPRERLRLLLDNLAAISEALGDGAVVVLEETRLRIRMLPIDPTV